MEDPRILGAAALRGVHDQRSLAERHTGKSSGSNGDLFPVEDVRAQIDMASFESATQIGIAPCGVA
jgi:hypothetical protein